MIFLTLKLQSHHEVIPGKARIYTHRLFTLGYNGDQIVEVNMTSSNPRVVEVGTPLKITTSITFIKSTIPFKDRFNRYLEYNFFESQIHWFSIFNSFMIVVFLAGLVALIMMRTLSLDYVRYSQQYDEDSIDMTMRDDSGWKRIHGDVFRPCSHLRMYAILMGDGAHVSFTLIVSLLCILIAGHYLGRERYKNDSNQQTIVCLPSQLWCT